LLPPWTDQGPILTVEDRLSRAGRRVVWTAVCLVVLATLAGAGWIAYRVWPRKLPLVATPRAEKISLRGGKVGIALPADVLVAEVGDYDRALDGYLYFDFLRSRAELDPHRILLCAGPPAPSSNVSTQDPKIFLLLDNNILAALPYLDTLMADRFVQSYSVRTWSFADLALCQRQSLQFEADFRPPPLFRLHQVPDRLLIDPLAEFIVFKASTDRRLLARAEPPPLVPSFEQAEEFAENTIVIARFYSLPLDYFLGIGAMENNYMSVRGDLDHAVWKRRPQRGDIVLERQRHRVLVRNYSLGVWQITRETLRYAQLLYVRDRNVRDYSSLPEDLRPTLLEDPGQVQPETITTYAGLIFRNLLDRFHGNIMEAVGAYNGGTLDPNPAYAASVHQIADYLRRAVVNAVALDSAPRKSPVAR
jgi:hypothetical protein